MPLVIQFNKRDMPNVRTDEEIDAMAAKGREPVYKAVALRGQGVLETLIGLVTITLGALEQEHKLSDKFGLRPDALVEDLKAKLSMARAAKGAR
jgi:hypothetical protein